MWHPGAGAVMTGGGAALSDIVGTVLAGVAMWQLMLVVNEDVAI